MPTGDLSSSEATAHTLEMSVETAPRCLVMELHDDRGVRSYPLSPAIPITLGSSRAANIQISDRTVSALHARITPSGSSLLVTDLGSKNGTYVGGARVAEADCSPWTTVSLGRSKLVCLPHVESAGMDADKPVAGLLGQSKAMRELRRAVRRGAQLKAPVLIAGETGTGKELVARGLHAEGPRRDGPFIVINVAALPRELVESELFGHERGAFTGAVARKTGAFELASGGTLFLDEIGELPIDAQPKLLRALDGYDLQRVGGASSRLRCDARVVAATHRPLSELVRTGQFRRDLFHRLDMYTICTPPLRERREDILSLANHILRSHETELGRHILAPSVAERLYAHDWLGNVRELRNVLYRAAVRCDQTTCIDLTHLDVSLRAPPRRATAEFSPEWFVERLKHHDGNVTAAARASGIPRTTFRKRLLEMGLTAK